MTQWHSYHRTHHRAQIVAEIVHGTIVEKEHPDPDYKGYTVYWVVLE